MKPERFKAVLFDLDGTLLDTLEDLADSMNAALAAFDLPVHPVPAYKKFVGEGVENLVLKAAPGAEGDEALRTRILKEMRAQYRRRWSVKSRPYPGIAWLLDGLEMRGLPKAVFSNKPHEFTSLCVSELLRDWRFDAVYGLSPEIPRKPDPTGALRIADELSVAPADFVYLGDTDTDMKTAVASGMFPVGALWGFRDERELRSGGARMLLEHPLQLLALLDGDHVVEP